MWGDSNRHKFGQRKWQTHQLSQLPTIYKVSPIGIYEEQKIGVHDEKKMAREDDRRIIHVLSPLESERHTLLWSQ